MSNFPKLFSSLQVGELQLAHRVVMAPLTRMRSTPPGDVPNALNAEYYGQRATSGGLLITEATQISLQGKGYPGAPGIHSDEQVQGWKLVTEAVHAKGGFIFLQLWHVGRISHSSLHPEAGVPVSASAIAPADGGKAFTAEFKQAPYETPRALELSELPGIVADYRRGAENAKAAGFDGVEVHGANGYLLDQFLEDKTNHRTDAYGGSIENRARLLLEVVDAVTEVWGKGRVGVRLSPYGTFSDMGDSDPVALFTYVLGQLSARGIAYAHVIEPRSSGSGGGAPANDAAPRTAEIFRDAFDGVFLSAGGYTVETAEASIEEGKADAVAFGRLFIANPDLPERFRASAELNVPDRGSFYGGTAAGYVDYPALDAVIAG
jgi:N-ethylmaleimide reductase